MTTYSMEEQIARQRKASKLIETVQRVVVDGAAFVSGLDDAGWRRLAEAAGVNVPSEATRLLVIDRFTNPEKYEPPSDPLEGLPR